MTNEDRRSRICLLLLLGGFVLAVALNLNGSSAALWSVILKDPATASALLLFSPQQDRSDEWLAWTPAMLSQVNHQPPFPVENPALGAGKSPLIMSMPVRHWSMLFRPHLYGFFLFDADRAFAWYWNAKIFGLLAAFIVLFRRLLGGSFYLAAFGSFLVFSSGYTQWWFSCPPMLPEMLSSWALAIVCTMTLATTRTRKFGILAFSGLVFASVNFALCMYPPFQIPLFWLGAVVLGGWFWENRSGKTGALPPGYTLFILAAAAAVTAAIIVPFFLECASTLKALASTSYPGARRHYGGGVGFFQLLSGLVAPLLTAKNFPAQFSSACASANFYPLWLVSAPLATLACRREKLGACMLAALLFFALFALCPLPHWIGRISLLHFCTEERLLLPIGIANIFLTMLVLRWMDTMIPDRKIAAGIFFAALAVVAGALWIGCKNSPQFFTLPVALALLCGWALVSATFLWGRPHLFGAVLLLTLSPAALKVNPLMQGLAPLTHASPLETVRAIVRSEPDARWVAYENSFLSSFLMAAGVPVISGPKTVPDLAFFRIADPEGQFRDIYNRYAVGVFALPLAPGEVSFKLVNFCGHQDFIHPTHPALRAVGVKFVVFPRALENPGDDGLELAKALPDNRIWIYRIH